MEIGETIPLPAKRQPFNRSRVGNGKVLLAMTDGRSMTARRFQDLFEDICGDLGGRDALSESQLQLVRRVATLSAEGVKIYRFSALIVQDIVDHLPSYLLDTVSMVHRDRKIFTL